ncbi:MAG: phosphate ABC transporter, permease protein PstA, partial [Cyanobacteria bacterium J06639_1]
MQYGATRAPWRVWSDRLSLAVALVCMGMVLLPLVAVVGYVVRQGVASWRWEAFVQLPPAAGLTGGGFGNAIVGTVMLVGMAAAFSVPLGVCAGIGAVEFGTAIATRWLAL